jgi:putative isomerase
MREGKESAVAGVSRRSFVGMTSAVLSLGSAAAANETAASATTLVDYFKKTGPSLLRPAMGLFKHPSIAPSLPGKEYSAELWDWDTLWTTRGLFRLADRSNDSKFRRALIEHGKGSLLNFLDYQSPEGRLPIVMSARNPDASWFPFRSADRNQAKPVMAQLARLVAEEAGDVAWLQPVFGKLLRFHESWLAHNETKTGLLAWSNDVAIGNDNDPTTFGRPPFSSANLLLNCLFYEDLRSIDVLARKLGRPQAELGLIAARLRKVGDAIQSQCWDDRDAFYYTADVQCVDQRAELIKNVPPGMDMSWATLPQRLQVFTGFLPLWCGLASREQADKLIKRNYLADDRFRAAAGVRTLSKLEKMYSLVFSSNPSNWLGPVWIISNYFVWKGLKNYGYTDLANELAGKTISLLSANLAKDGSLNEYYHPETGAPLSHKGFMDWNLLVLEMM